MDEVIKNILMFALENAISYSGKANPNALVGKVMGHFPDKRKDMKGTLDLIKKVVDDVNKLDLNAQKKKLEELSPGKLAEKEKEKEDRKGRHGELKDLPNVNGKVVLRFEPSPSGALHVGHAYALSINHLYKKKYGGELILRISDTDPTNIDPQAYKLIEEGAQWLTSHNVDKVVIQSDRMEIYYEYAQELIYNNHGYVCTCTGDLFRDFSKAKEDCPCRNLPQKIQLERWDKMFNGYQPGDAVVRAKFGMNDPNPAMRDFPLMRISDSEHIRQGKKYRVWPLMNFAVAIDDHDFAQTHVLRGKDHFDNTKRQRFIYKAFGWKEPEYVHLGKINFLGLKLSTSETRALIEEGKYSGWDDIRLPFLPALRRRGFSPDALVNFYSEVGVTLTDKTMEAKDFFKGIEYHNTKSLEPIAHRYFFVNDPVEISVEGAPELDVELDLHPDNKKGGRFLHTQGEFIISRSDFNRIREGKEWNGEKEGDIWRLMDCMNIVRREGKFRFHSQELDVYRKEGKGIIHWLPSGKGSGRKNIDVSVRMPDNSILSGKGEALISGIEPGKIVQFERFGFVRRDGDGSTGEFWFTHG